MKRLFQLSLITMALAGASNAAVIAMNSIANFTGGNDLTFSALDNNTSTRLVATFNGVSATIDLLNVGEVDWLPLGTLEIGEGLGGAATPNITAAEFNDGYQMTISVNTTAGLLNFFANNGLFSLVNFSPGASDDDTTDAAEEIVLNLSTLSEQRTVGLVTILFSIVDDEFGDDSTIELNQNGTAETVWLRAEVIRVDQPNPTSTPEPSTMALVGSGLIGIALVGRRVRERRD